MTYRVLYAREAAKSIAKLDKTVKERVRKAVARISEHPELGKPLTGLLSGRWSYRAGDWRILYRVRRSELLILVLTVGHRSDVYAT